MNVITNANRYRFRPKTYGYGATPITWEGWAVTIGIVVAMVGIGAPETDEHEMLGAGGVACV
jgi:hypothetical protein